MPPIENDMTLEEQMLFEQQGGAAPEAQSEEQTQQQTEESTPPAADPAPIEGEQGQDSLPGQQNQPRMVPHEALHSERLARQEAQRRADQVTARFNAMVEAQRRAEGAPAALPDMTADPEGYLRALEERVLGFEQERQEERVNRETDQTLERDEASFTAYTPDYPQASEYYVQSRAKELMIYHSPEQAQRLLTNEVRAIAQQSWQRGIPAAQGIYDIAKARGYRPGAPSPFADPAAPAPAPKPGVAPAAAVEAIKQGQEASRSLSGGQGGSPVATLNAEALLAMSDDEFEAHMKLGTRGANALFESVAGR